MRIGEVAAESRISVQTVRYYERRGLIPAPERGVSGQRRCGDDVLQRLRFIRRAQELGFTLANQLRWLWALGRCAWANGK